MKLATDSAGAWISVPNDGDALVGVGSGECDAANNANAEPDADAGLLDTGCSAADMATLGTCRMCCALDLALSIGTVQQYRMEAGSQDSGQDCDFYHSGRTQQARGKQLMQPNTLYSLTSHPTTVRVWSMICNKYHSITGAGSGLWFGG